jgi:DNA-binding transcriptional LysR family regulator
VEGPLIVNESQVAVRAVLDGVGIAYLFDSQVQPYVAEGKMVPLLREWSPPFPAFISTIRAGGRCCPPCAPSSIS